MMTEGIQGTPSGEKNRKYSIPSNGKMRITLLHVPHASIYLVVGVVWKRNPGQMAFIIGAKLVSEASSV